MLLLAHQCIAPSSETMDTFHGPVTTGSYTLLIQQPQMKRAQLLDLRIPGTSPPQNALYFSSFRDIPILNHSPPSSPVDLLATFSRTFFQEFVETFQQNSPFLRQTNQHLLVLPIGIGKTVLVQELTNEIDTSTPGVNFRETVNGFEVFFPIPTRIPRGTNQQVNVGWYHGLRLLLLLRTRVARFGCLRTSLACLVLIG
jgi:hypothetical protein